MTTTTKVTLSDVMKALDAIADWTRAVQQELRDYLEQGGTDIDLATPAGEVGTSSTKKVETVRGGGAPVGRSC